MIKDRMFVLLCEHRGDVHLVVVGRHISSLFDSHGAYTNYNESKPKIPRYNVGSTDSYMYDEHSKPLTRT